MLHRLTLMGFVTLALALVAPAAASASADRWIVVLEPGTDASATADDHARRHGVGVSNVYRHALRGYAGVIPDARLAAVRNDARVAYVERDGVATASAQTLPWGIDRIDADVSSTRAGNGSGTVPNVNVYVLDTGVDAGHRDLNVVGHVNFASGKNADCNGHGTHVAGTIAARDDANDVVGVAPGAPITGVKVLGCSGSGSYSGIIAGVDWVTANARKPAIANMSLGGGVSAALDAAVRRSADSGVFYAVAAGNDGANACNYSPARAGTHNGIATVAATDPANAEASWSNFGSCVDLWAPGVSILSTRRSGGTTTMSGTSMASPHVGGGGALYLSTHATASAASVESALKAATWRPGTTSKGASAISLEYVGGF